MKTAKFSNGYEDTYKGKRDVKVGWALFRLSDDEVVASGHSLSHKAAESTAKGNMKIHYDIKWCESIHGKREGVTKEDVKRMKRENSEYKASLRMEIVEL